MFFTLTFGSQPGIVLIISLRAVKKTIRYFCVIFIMAGDSGADQEKLTAAGRKFLIKPRHTFYAAVFNNIFIISYKFIYRRLAEIVYRKPRKIILLHQTSACYRRKFYITLLCFYIRYIPSVR